MRSTICVKCEVELQRVKGGSIVIVEHFNKPPEPYKLWSADLHKCPKCGLEVVAGIAQEPFMEHYQGDIKAKIEELRNKGIQLVNDFEVNK
jgi:hypothetical protein